MNAMTVIEALQRQGVKTDRLCLDSRRVERGDIFVAIPGARSDGRTFIDAAVQRGAAAVLYEAEGGKPIDTTVPGIAVEGLNEMLGDIANIVYGRPSERLQVVGITGTNGKTTVSQWVAQALNGLGRRCAVMGTLGNGFPGQLKESANTTPDAVTVQRGLAEFATQGAGACAMEISSIGLDQGRINGVNFDTAVFTNLTRDHLDYHADMGAYAAAKARLFAMPGLKNAVLNLDDPFGVEVAALLQGRVRIIGYTMTDATGVDEVVTVQNLRMSATGIEFSIGSHPVSVPVIGRFNVANLLAVFCTLRALGVDDEHAATALASLSSPPGRLQTTGGHDQPLVVVDYAHTPDALEKVLITLRETAVARGGKLMCVFGCGGDRDPGKRPMMGAVAERLADRVVITSDNPRSEDPTQIALQIIAGMKIVPLLDLDRAQAIRDVIDMAKARDVILLAGKGHEPYQEIKGVKTPFSDMGSAQRALENRK